MLDRPRRGTIVFWCLSSYLLAYASACSSQKAEAKQDSGALDTSPDRVVTARDGAARDESPDQTITGAVWTDESLGIDVSCFGFFEGSKRIRATRDQLSEDQLRVLSGLTLIPRNDQCVEDTTSCSVTVTTGDGTSAVYVTDQLDSSCGQTAPQISFASFELFLQSVPCRAAKQGDEIVDGGRVPLSLWPDVRCFDGLFTAPPDTVRRFLIVDDPTVPRHIELDSCNDGRRSPALLHPHLLAPDGTTPLPAVWAAALTDPGADGTCYRLDYTFPATGAYVLSIDVDAGFTAGDFYVRFY